ncbi:hypothetical protein MMYC01_200464 [Madurella mycetomatis]|uniref:Uncharacterized protein n=1 Tax=Madurella mycetomatis TaxID=100816 RepID=A0A175WGV2_9PEZI|nr:hypothetical protein MMYC01_208600 [Madurella mycetomatis]KXX83067.1 hypothetical protein MMYC01_200464 [Madurella mycetomatis]
MAQMVQAPSRPEVTSWPSIFLAGTTSATPGPDWRETLISTLSHLPVTVYNPLRSDWESLLPEDVTSAPFREQVEWELEMQQRADVVVVYFGAGTDAPISLLELGLCARSNKAIVACHRGYRKRGNVEIVCQRYGITFLNAEEDWAASVLERLQGLLISKRKCVSSLEG